MLPFNQNMQIWASVFSSQHSVKKKKISFDWITFFERNEGHGNNSSRKQILGANTTQYT